MAKRPNAKILVVDDDADWRGYLRLAVEQLGYEVVEASNGDEALAWVEQGDIRLILLDLRMPGMDGGEVLERLPEDHPRVVFLTSASADEVGPLRDGPHYYLPKHAGPGELELLLQSLDG